MHFKVRVARRSLAGVVELGFTVGLTHLPAEVQRALDAGEMELHYASDGGDNWILALTPADGRGLYSALEAGLVERAESPGDGPRAAPAPVRGPSGTERGGFQG